MRLIKVYKAGYISQARYVSIYDTDEEKILNGTDTYSEAFSLEVGVDPTPSPSPTPTPNPSNQPPILNLDPPGDQTVVEGDILTIQLLASDPDGNLLTFSANNLPPGAIFDDWIGRFTWIPQSLQNGVYPDVEFSVSDGMATTSQTITITVLEALLGISGSIRDEQGVPQTGLEVRLYNHRNRHVIVTFTNSDGYYEFGRLTTDRYTVRPTERVQYYFDPPSQTGRLINNRDEKDINFTYKNKR